MSLNVLKTIVKILLIVLILQLLFVFRFYYDLLESQGPMKADSSDLLQFLEYEKAANELVCYHCCCILLFVFLCDAA